MTIIRLTVVADIPAVVRLTVAENGGSPEAFEARLQKDLALAERYTVVADNDGQVLGFGRVRHFEPDRDAPVNVAPTGFYLNGLIVVPEHRGQGLGSRLTEARIAWVAERASQAWYFTDAANEVSIRLHANLGFREVTRDFTFPGAGPEAGVLFQLDLA